MAAPGTIPGRARAYAAQQAGRARDYIDEEVGPGAGTKKVYVKAAPLYQGTFTRNARIFFLFAFALPFLMAMVAKPTLLVRIGVMLAWIAPLLGCCGTCCAVMYQPCWRRLGAIVLCLAGALLFLRSVLTFLSFGLFWPSFDSRARSSGPGSAQDSALVTLLSFCGGAADVVIFIVGLLLYCSYSRQLAATLSDRAPRPRVKVRVPPVETREEARGRRAERRASWERRANERRASREAEEEEEEDLEDGRYRGPETAAEPGVPAWALEEMERVREGLLALDESARRARLRELRRQYHPDKNKGNEHLVTPVFQYVQMWYEDTQD